VVKKEAKESEKGRNSKDEELEKGRKDRGVKDRPTCWAFSSQNPRSATDYSAIRVKVT